MRLAAILLAAGVAMPVSAWQDVAHKNLTQGAVDQGLFNGDPAPDMVQYQATIVNNSYGGVGGPCHPEEQAHGGPVDGCTDKGVFDWISYDGGPFDKWIPIIQSDYAQGHFSDAYREIGYLVHLIEDQNSPPHAANIAHGFSDHFEAASAYLAEPPSNLGFIDPGTPVTIPSLNGFYSNAVTNARTLLPSYSMPVFGVQYWNAGPSNYVGLQSLTDGHYGCLGIPVPPFHIFGSTIVVTSLQTCDLFIDRVSPTIIPDQSHLATKYAAGLLIGISKLLPPIIQQGASVSPQQSDGSSPFNIQFHALENRTQTVYLYAEVFDSNDNDKGAAFTKYPIVLGAGTQLPWEGDQSVAWDPTTMSLPNDTYQLQLKLQDGDGNVSAPVTVSFTLDNQNPSTTATDSDGNPITPGTTAGNPGACIQQGQCVMANASAGPSGVSSVTISGLQPLATPNGGVSPKAGPYCNLAPGDYTLTATNGLGKQSAPFPFCVGSTSGGSPLVITGAGYTGVSPIIGCTQPQGIKLLVTVHGGDFWNGVPANYPQLLCQKTQLSLGGTCVPSSSSNGAFFDITALVPIDSVGYTVTNPFKLALNIGAGIVLPGSGGTGAGIATPSGLETVSGHISVPECLIAGVRKSTTTSGGGVSVQTQVPHLQVNPATLPPPAASAAQAQGLVAASPQAYSVTGSTIFFVSPQPVSFQFFPSPSLPVPLDQGSLAIYLYNGVNWTPTGPLGQGVAPQPDGSIIVASSITRTGILGVFFNRPDKLPPVTSLSIGDPGNPGAGTVFVSSLTPISFGVSDDAVTSGDGFRTQPGTTNKET